MSMSGRKIAVIGSGSWGTAVAHVLADAKHDVTIWGRDAATVEAIQTKHENPKYLKGLALSPSLKASTDLSKTIREAEWVVCSIPTQLIRKVFAPIAGEMQGKPIINTSKGIEGGTHATVSEIFAEVAPKSPYVILSGPSFAQEVVQRLPTLVTLASKNEAILKAVQEAFSTSYFRAYRSSDVIGVELAGALKNVVAIASGMVAGLKLGYNSQAAIINRGIAEITRMGIKRGADPMTFLGLAGMGDLILTCTGPLSRNRRVGVSLGEGKKLPDIQRELGGVAEGVYTAQSAFELAQRNNVEMPITEQVFQILYLNGTPQEALTQLMSRGLKEEWT